MRIWYSVQNGGDGSAYPVFMECKEQAELDQKYMCEGWGEPCVGSLTIEEPLDGRGNPLPVNVKGITTIAAQIEELEKWLEYDSGQQLTDSQEHISKLKQLQELREKRA